MSISMRVEVLDRDVLFTPGFGLSPAERSAALADYAADVIADATVEATAAFGTPPDVSVAVDGLIGRPLSAVKPDGTIVATLALSVGVVVWIFEQVVAHSPRLTGEYAASHRVFADGVEVDSPQAAAGAKQVVISPTVPYARKIEGTRKKPESSQAPAGVYQVVAAMAAARFGNVARIKFTYQGIMAPGSGLEAWAAGHIASITHERRRRSQAAKDLRQPAIVIDMGD